jgi:hypothetical protein
MKSLNDFKTILTEEEKQDYQKFDTLVRAGLANKSQINRLHKILGKMGEDRPVFNQQDRQLMQDLFNKMIDLVTNNKQIFQQTRRAVREDVELDEAIVDTADYKVDRSGRKYKAHRIKIGDDAAQVGDDAEQDQNLLKKEEVSYLQEGIDPPFVLILKRKAVRYYPEGIRVALYYNERLNRYFNVPYSATTPMDSPIQAEETIVEETIDHMGQLQKIKDAHQYGVVNHVDGTTSKVDAQTAHALLTIHKHLKPENQKKFADMIGKSKSHLQKAAEFSHSKLK